MYSSEAMKESRGAHARDDFKTRDGAFYICVFTHTHIYIYIYIYICIYIYI